MLKQIAEPAYHALHDALYATWHLNPFFKKEHGNKKIMNGFIGDEHLDNPTLDDILFEKLKSQSITCRQHALNKSAYKEYIAATAYPADYYGGQPGKNNFTEKTLEHYTTFEFIDFEKVSCFVDIAACTSPFAEIVEQKYKVPQVYKQDLVYPRGIKGNKIGGYAHETNLPSGSVDAITLHCSLEHFEGDSDKQFLPRLIAFYVVAAKH
ncbi:MAG: hypothetical protein IPO27_00345 [Bacteroidetes bacterium]|nr:hypothetical protein [Bacteroidota bacterium]